MNNDTFADVIIGAPNSGVSRTGTAYVIFGSHFLTVAVALANLSNVEGYIINGESPQDGFGLSVCGAGSW